MPDKIQFKRRKHFLLLGVIPSVLFLAFVIMSQSWQQEVHQVNSMQSTLNHSYHMFYGELYEEAKIISALTELLTQSKVVQDAFLKGDEEELLEKVSPFYQKMNNEYNITHCYFLSNDKEVILRAHYPDYSGDIIDRFTLNEAVKTEAVSYGLELGTMGTLTLRVVLPWRVGGKVIGYLELGKQVDHVINEMKKTLEVDLVLVVNKEHLSETAGEDGYGIKKPVFDDWDQFPDVVVFGMTMDRMPPIINSDLAMAHHSHKDLMLDISVDGRQFLAGFAPLYDASDKDIGDIVIIKDFTELKAVEKRLTLLMIAGYILCILLYMTFVFAYLHGLKRKLNN